MSNFRLNAKKPANNAGLPTAKTELYLLYVEDIISMPEVNEKGILTTSDIIIKDGRRFHILYQTPSSQVHTRTIEGDTDSRGFKKKLTGSYPGDDLEINEFVKQNVNQGFVILVKSCNSNVKKIYGSKCNPLYYTGTFTDDNDRKGYELTFEQEFADDTPVLFYTGNVLVDEDALSPTNPEFSSLFVKLDASNITEENREALRERLGIGDVLPNIATIDLGEETGNAYTKEQIGQIMRTKVNFPMNPPTLDVLGFERIRFLVGYEEELNTVPGQNEPHFNAVRFNLSSIGKNIGDSNLKIPQGQIRELDVTGAKLRIKGLENRKNDASVNLKLMQDAQGNTYVSDKEDIAFNFPENFSASLTVNHLYPSQIPDRPAFADDLKRVLEGYRSYQFTPITQNEWVLKTKENKGLSSQYLRNDGSVSLSGGDTEFNNYTIEEEVITLTAPSVVLPKNGDWILKVRCGFADKHHGNTSRIGVAQGNTPVNVGIIGGRYGSTTIINNSSLETGERNNLFVLIIKTGAIVSVLIYSNGNVIYNSQSVFSELGDFSPQVSLCRVGGFTGSMEYKIL